MIISHKYRFVFVHIPKTGGTSIVRTLAQDVGKHDVIFHDDFKEQNHNRQHFPINAGLNNLYSHSLFRTFEKKSINKLDYTLFAVVRNPWDRLVSMYHNLKETDKFGHVLETAPSFQQWILSDVQKIKTDMPLSIQIMYKKRSQIEWIKGINGIPTKKFLGRLENLLSNKVNDWYREDIEYFGYEF